MVKFWSNVINKSFSSENYLGFSQDFLKLEHQPNFFFGGLLPGMGCFLEEDLLFKILSIIYLN